VFPEGTRREGAELGPLFSGAAYLALKQGVPILPVGIGGSEEIIVKRRGIPLFSRVCVVVGEPIMCARTEGTIKRSAITATNDELRARLQACLSEAIAWSIERSGGQSGEGV
jgi:1-acyl-sn-glycerol-3-phosphate acyltransferase